MKQKKYIFLALIFISSMCGKLVSEEPEIENEIIELKSRFNKPESQEIYQKLSREVLNRNPRLFELSRRIDADENAWGDFPNFKQLAYSQVDQVIQEGEKFKNGILAGRLVVFLGKDAISITCWKRMNINGDSTITKESWMRLMPRGGIDQANPLPSWYKVHDKIQLDEDRNLAFLENLCRDPMPPTIVPLHVKQKFPEAAIIELVKKSGNVVSYQWAIRSNTYTTGYGEFSKVWNDLTAGKK